MSIGHKYFSFKHLRISHFEYWSYNSYSSSPSFFSVPHTLSNPIRDPFFLIIVTHTHIHVHMHTTWWAHLVLHVSIVFRTIHLVSSYLTGGTCLKKTDCISATIVCKSSGWGKACEMSSFHVEMSFVIVKMLHKWPYCCDFINTAPCHINTVTQIRQLTLIVGEDKFSVGLNNLSFVSLIILFPQSLHSFLYLKVAH